MKCRSGDHCEIDAGVNERGVERWFCEEHQAQLDRVKAQLGVLHGPAADRACATFALDIARAVWDGQASNLHEVVGMSRTSALYRQSLSVAQRKGLITSTGTRYAPGENTPSGVTASPPVEPEKRRTSQRDHVKTLAKYVRESDHPVGRQETADALGLAPGSVSRIVRKAKDEGLIRALPGPLGLVPVEQAAA